MTGGNGKPCTVLVIQKNLEDFTYVLVSNVLEESCLITPRFAADGRPKPGAWKHITNLEHDNECMMAVYYAMSKVW